MKSIFILSLLALSLNTFSSTCPELSGAYHSCYVDNGSGYGIKEVKITQAIENNVTVYNFSTLDVYGDDIQTKFIADGKEYIEYDADEDLKVTLIAKCVDAEFIESFEMDGFKLHTKYNKDSDGKLIVKSSMEDDFESADVEICFPQ